MAKIDEIMKKLSANEVLTNEENNYLYKKLNLIYGNAPFDDGIFVEYPMNLYQVIVGDRNIHYTTPEDEEKLKERIEYVLERYLPEDEANVIRLRFKKHLTLEETAKVYNVTRNVESHSEMLRAYALAGASP